MNTAKGHKPLLLTAMITALTLSYANISVAAEPDPQQHSWQDRMGLESYEQQRAELEKSLSNADTVAQLRAGLQKAGYATDPDYASKLSRAINSTMRLQQQQQSQSIQA